MGEAVAFILKGYPRLSETFIAQEIAVLEKRGLDIRIISLRHPTDEVIHPVHEEIKAPVSYLPEYLYQEPSRVFAAWRSAVRLPGYRSLMRQWRKDFRRDRTANRLRRLGQAFVLVRELPREVVHLHAHFLHTPASVARYASMLRNLPWSFSAHAKDIWTSPRWEKAEKIMACDWGVTCTGVSQQHLRSLTETPEKVDLVYHGLDLERFPAPAGGHYQRTGRADEEPVTIFSVGRAVEKKGFDDLLVALRLLPAALNWRFVHVGGGPLLGALKQQARQLQIGERIAWLGPKPQHEVLKWYRSADVFVLASRVAADGDRDGLPNVLVEAQSQVLACVTTNVSAIPELICDAETGILVEPRDTAALARGLQRLIEDPALRERYARAGFIRVRDSFSLEANIQSLCAKFDKVVRSAVRET